MSASLNTTSCLNHINANCTGNSIPLAHAGDDFRN